MHGPSDQYASSYPDEMLSRWARDIRAMGVARAWVYFNNDIGGHAPRDALRLKQLVAAEGP
ncbi:MAG: DUF72 domain-containing protein [Dehalococcoidia bacterium]|nr:DUF72 domain-containing protein [Dehalococcoidia bacterium]